MIRQDILTEIAHTERQLAANKEQELKLMGALMAFQYMLAQVDTTATSGTSASSAHEAAQ